MHFEECPHCRQFIGFKRHIGVGTLLGTLFTLGWWLLVVLFYPLRCIRCGYNQRMSAWQKAGVTAVCAVPILAVGSMLSRSAASTLVQSPQHAQIIDSRQASRSYAAASTASTPKVQFIGCTSDGQGGPVPAPSGQAPELQITADDAAQLAWYKSPSAPGVLAPRGWNCFGTYGSNGASLYVSPGPIDSELVFSKSWKGFNGPVIQISTMDGGTSGRFEVARKIARLFPERMDFTRRIVAEGLVTANDFPEGPFLSDKITYKTASLAEFETPAGASGMGTQSMLLPSDEPITGLVFVTVPQNGDPYDVSLQIRLPHDMAQLASTILSGAERVSLNPTGSEN